MPHTADPCPGAEDYLAFARDRDPAALDRALRACADRAYTQARHTLGNGADADDAAQEAFLQLVRTAPQYDGTVPFGAWLGRLVRIACLRVLRSDRRRRRREEAVMAQPAPVEDPDRAEQVRALVARLPAADRAAVELHYFAGLPQAEVAAALGSSENAVALRLSRARARLRSLLGGASLSVVAALLAAQPAYAAPPQVLAGIAPLTSAIAVGAALPATTVPLSTLQKGLLFMSTHPFAAAAILFALLGAGLLPVALAAGEAKPPPPVAVGPQPWRGKARELLPFLDPAAPAQLAVDGAYVRQLALAAKPTSLLADPRAQPALAHIREQFRLWRAAGGGAPEWAQVIAEAEGAVLGMEFGAPSEVRVCLVAELGASAAGQMQGMVEGSGRAIKSPAVVGGFRGVRVGTPAHLFARDGGRWAMAEPDLLAAGLARRTAPIPPAGLWARIDLGGAIAQLVRMDPVADPLSLGSLLGDGWRRLRPQFACSLSTEKGVWRAETRLTGASRLPLRPVQPGIAGCVPADAAASLLLGCDPERLVATIAPFIDPSTLEALLAQVRRYGIEPAALPGQLSGDVAVVMRQKMPLPEFGVVLGLRPGAAAALRGGLDELAAAGGLASEPAVAPALAAWSGVLRIGVVQMRLAADRLVISSGDAAALLAPPPRQIDAALTVDADLPALARTWLPQLLVLLPAKSRCFELMNPLYDVLKRLAIRPEIHFPDRTGDRKGPLDLTSLQHDDYLQEAWRQLVGKDLPMQPHVAVYSGQGHIARTVVVLRCADGWRVIGPWPNATYEMVTDPVALDRRLSGLELAAGTPAAGLAPIAISESPTFDRRWLPPLPAIVEHLPAYRLQLQPTADGFTLLEEGLPLASPLLLFTATLRSTQVVRLRGEAILRRDGPALRQRHARAIAALRRTVKALESRSPEAAPLMSPSAVLAAAGTDPAELASLCDGAVPDAARLDRLGFFHPSGWPHQQFGWQIPLADGLFLECHWAHRPEGCDIVASPYTPQRPPTAEELARVRPNRDPAAADPAPAPPKRASDF